LLAKIADVIVTLFVRSAGSNQTIAYPLHRTPYVQIGFDLIGPPA